MAAALWSPSRSPGKASNEDQSVAPALRAVATVQARYPGLRIQEAGDASYSQAINSVLARGFRRAEATSVPITLVLLLLVFGALVAAGIPLLLALTSVVTALSLLTVFSRWLPVGSSTSEVVLIIGMAVGVDYSLFYLRREREERTAGHSTAEALQDSRGHLRASDHGVRADGHDRAGRAVPDRLRRIQRHRLRHDCRGRRGRPRLTDRGARVAVLARGPGGPGPDPVPRPQADRSPPVAGVGRPGTPGGTASCRCGAATAAIALLALAAPAAGMRLGSPAVDLPASSPVLQTMNRISAAFPQTPSPAQVVVTGQDLTGPAVRHAIVTLNARASADGPDGPIRGPVTATQVADGRALIVYVPLAGNGTNSVSDQALLTLRNRVLPSTLGTVSGISYAVTGNTAGNYDDMTALHSRTLVVFAFVARARVPAAPGRVPLGRHPADLDRAEPALGGGRLRADHADLPGWHGCRASSATPPSAGSSRGSRCSCSCSCSG